MSLKKNIAAFFIATSAIVSFMSFPAYAEGFAEEDLYSDEEGSEEDNYITSGDYKYSVKTYDDGSDVAFLEEYTGEDTKVEIPETIDDYVVKGLGDKTFYLNEKITEITISENLADFGYYPFYGCTSLMEFKVNEKNEIYTADSDGALVGKDGLAFMSYPTGKKTESYTLAEGVVAINSSAFAMCKDLKEITLPESVEFIGNFTFSECTSLESIVLPDKIAAIGNFMFSGCTKLKDVTLPTNLQKIGNASFFKCESLELIEFPTTLTEVGQAAFCSTGITSIKIPATITNIGYSAFGFHTDDEDQIVVNENFLIKGYSTSYAKTYSTESGITFLALDEVLGEESPQNEEDKKDGLAPGIIAGICVVGGILVITVIVAIVKKSKGTDDGEDESEEDDTEEEE